MKNRPETIVLAKFLRIGDRVTLCMDPEVRSWGRNGPPDGTQGTVIGFHRYDTYYSRVDACFGKKPGKHIGNGAPMVKWDGVELATPASAHDLRWASNFEETKKARREDKVWNEAFETSVKIGELPELPIWEWDVVTLVTTNVGANARNQRLIRNYGDLWFVENIDYDQIDEKRNDGVTPMPIYRCIPFNNDDHERLGPSCSFDVTEVVLHQRGNVWKWFNGERESITWRSLQDECAFHARVLNGRHELKNPHTNLYSFSIRQALGMLFEGKGDVIQAGRSPFSGLFGGGRPQDDKFNCNVYKFDDVDLGSRVRRETLNGFKDMVPPGTYDVGAIVAYPEGSTERLVYKDKEYWAAVVVCLDPYTVLASVEGEAMWMIGEERPKMYQVGVATPETFEKCVRTLDDKELQQKLLTEFKDANRDRYYESLHKELFGKEYNKEQEA